MAKGVPIMVSSSGTWSQPPADGRDPYDGPVAGGSLSRPVATARRPGRRSAPHSAASAACRALTLLTHVRVTFPGADAETRPAAARGLVHGPVFLHLGGGLGSFASEATTSLVTAAVHALSDAPRRRARARGRGG
ncbi:hypothetical protein G3M53_11145, partial [Streptomyces sp. SID7982]|nr:hypothetical protein [Streptomyces sp. SID7982]